MKIYSSANLIFHLKKIILAGRKQRSPTNMYNIVSRPPLRNLKLLLIHITCIKIMVVQFFLEEKAMDLEKLIEEVKRV